MKNRGRIAVLASSLQLALATCALSSAALAQVREVIRLPPPPPPPPPPLTGGSQDSLQTSLKPIATPPLEVNSGQAQAPNAELSPGSSQPGTDGESAPGETHSESTGVEPEAEAVANELRAARSADLEALPVTRKLRRAHWP